MESKYEFAEKYAARKLLTVINIFPIKFTATGLFWSSKALFVLTESHFLIFEKNKDQAFFKIPWKSLSLIKVKDIKTILVFRVFVPDKSNITTSENFEDRTITIWSYKSDFKSMEIQKKIIVLLQRVLTKSELSKIQMSELNEQTYLPTHRSPVARYSMWELNKDPLFSNDVSSYIELHKAIVRLFVFRNPNFQLNDLAHIEKVLPIYLDILKVAPQIQSLRIPLIPVKRLYNHISGLLENNDYLRYIQIPGDCSEDFFYIASAIKDSKGSKISSLSFVNARFSTNGLNQLSDLILNSGNINVLELHSSVPVDSIDYFYSSFLSPEICEKLAAINLSKSPNVNVHKLFPKLAGISMLSLADCGVDLVDVFEAIVDTPRVNLSVLDISGCAVKSLPDRNFPQFNQNLKKLVINNVSWPLNTLVPFFVFFFSHFRRAPDAENGISGPSLYFSDETAEVDEWISLFNYFDKVDDYRDLEKLAWRGNPVEQSLFNFLKKNEGLSELNLSGCFSESSPDSINILCNYLRSAPPFRTLLICGNEQNFFGRFTAEVVKALVNHPTLRVLDVSDNRGGDAAIGAVSTLVDSNSKIEIISFDNSFPEKSEQLVNLLKTLDKKKGQIQTSFPLLDFSRLKEDKLISRELFEEINSCFRIPAVDPADIHVPETPKDNNENEGENEGENKSGKSSPKKDKKKKKKKEDEDEENETLKILPSQLLTKNYCIFKYYPPDDFPSIVKKEEQEKLVKLSRTGSKLASPKVENDTFLKSPLPLEAAAVASSPDSVNERIWPNSPQSILKSPESTQSPIRIIDQSEEEPQEQLPSPQKERPKSAYRKRVRRARQHIHTEEESDEKLEQNQLDRKIGAVENEDEKYSEVTVNLDQSTEDGKFAFEEKPETSQIAETRNQREPPIRRRRKLRHVKRASGGNLARKRKSLAKKEKPLQFDEEEEKSEEEEVNKPPQNNSPQKRQSDNREENPFPIQFEEEEKSEEEVNKPVQKNSPRKRKAVNRNERPSPKKFEEEEERPEEEKVNKLPQKKLAQRRKSPRKTPSPKPTGKNAVLRRKSPKRVAATPKPRLPLHDDFDEEEEIEKLPKSPAKSPKRSPSPRKSPQRRQPKKVEEPEELPQSPGRKSSPKQTKAKSPKSPQTKARNVAKLDESDEPEIDEDFGNGIFGEDADLFPNLNSGDYMKSWDKYNEEFSLNKLFINLKYQK